MDKVTSGPSHRETGPTPDPSSDTWAAMMSTETSRESSEAWFLSKFFLTHQLLPDFFY